jgi:hypothetical protein
MDLETIDTPKQASPIIYLEERDGTVPVVLIMETMLSKPCMAQSKVWMKFAFVAASESTQLTSQMTVGSPGHVSQERVPVYLS